MVCCLTAPSHYLIQYRLLWFCGIHHSVISQRSFKLFFCMYNECENYTLKITVTSPSGQWVTAISSKSVHITDTAGLCELLILLSYLYFKNDLMHIRILWHVYINRFHFETRMTITIIIFTGVSGLFEENSQVPGEFLSQRAISAENVST